MALVTTAGANDADSYATLADADAYFTARGIATWTGTDAVKENALRRATSFLDNQYRWRGLKATATQALAWPRVDGVRDPYRPSLTYLLLDGDGFEIADDVVPVAVQRATMEAALLTLTGVTLEPRIERGGAVKRQRKKVGPLEKETEWQDGAPAVDRFLAIEGLLRALVTSTRGATSGNIRVVRA